MLSLKEKVLELIDSYGKDLQFCSKGLQKRGGAATLQMLLHVFVFLF